MSENAKEEIEELRKLLEEIPEIAEEGRKKYMAMDLMGRLRRVCYAHPMMTSSDDQRGNLIDVAKRIFYIRHEFGEDAAAQMTKWAVKFLCDEYGKDSEWRAKAVTSIKSAINEQKIYIKNLWEDSD